MTTAKIELPPALAALLKKPPLLKGESPQEHEALLAIVMQDLQPADVAEAMWAIRFSACTWELMRCQRMRAVVMNRWWDAAFLELLELHRLPNSHCNSTERLAFAKIWKGNPQGIGIDPDVISAQSVVLAQNHLDYFDERIERLQRSSDSILQMLEGRREIFAHRAKEFAREVREGKVKLYTTADSADSMPASCGRSGMNSVHRLAPPAPGGRSENNSTEG